MKAIRIIAILVGLGTIAWQMSELAAGRADNMFFLPDIVVGLFLAGSALIRPERRAQVLMLCGFGLMSGIYSVATLGQLWLGALDAGGISTAVGLAFTLPSMAWLAARLGRD